MHVFSINRASKTIVRRFGLGNAGRERRGGGPGCGRRVPLARMLDCYQRRFSVTDTSRILAGLCFFDDAEAEPMPVMLVPLDWETVKRDQRAMVRKMVRE